MKPITRLKNLFGLSRPPKNMAHSMRLFPKNKGANAYNLSGISSCCDWVVLSDLGAPYVYLQKTNATNRPRHIFLSLRNPRVAISHLIDKVLPNLSHPFVLVSGSEDVTIPHQLDKRWNPFDSETVEKIKRIADHPLLIHWFAENLDQVWHKKVSPFPTGMVFRKKSMSSRLITPKVPLLSERPLRVLCGHRVRDGAQWKVRKDVTLIAKEHWKGFTDVLSKPVSQTEYLAAVSRVSFVLCVEGGGIDPSPKAWKAIQYGAIPIIKFSSLSEAYSELPCMFVEDWVPSQLSVARLEARRKELMNKFTDPISRAEVMEKLTARFWWGKIESAQKKVKNL